MYCSNNIFHFHPNQNKSLNIIIVYFSVANRRSSANAMREWPIGQADLTASSVLFSIFQKMSIIIYLWKKEITAFYFLKVTI